MRQLHVERQDNFLGGEGVTATQTTDAIAWLEQHHYAKWRLKLAKLPPHMRAGVSRYVAFGEPIGGFLTAVFSDSLKGAFRAADSKNFVAMPEWAHFVYWDVPANCQGSLEKVEAWQAQGGLRGTSP